MKISRARSIRGTITLPGDKSISHRAAMLAAMADGETRIDNFATSADCSSTLSCLRSLGVKIRRDGDLVFIKGVGKSGFTRPTAPLDCGNSGTTMRLLAGILAGQNFESVLTGDESLRTRPMRRVIEPLKQMGAVIESDDCVAPINISGRNPLKAIEYHPPVASAQIKSCILLAGLNSDGTTSVLERVKTRDHTERMLEWFGVEVQIDDGENGSRITVSGSAKLTANNISIASDISSAAFFMAAAACLHDSEITLPNIGINPGRRAIIDVLQGLGVEIEILEPKIVCNEPVATIKVCGGFAKGRGPHILRDKIIANLIDELPVLAVLGTQLESGIEIRDAAELRVKESDRISAIVKNLTQMGADVTEFPDGFSVGRSNLKGSRIESYGDHRIAMAFAVAGLFAEGETAIIGAECADGSFPGFFETLKNIVR